MSLRYFKILYLLALVFSPFTSTLASDSEAQPILKHEYKISIAAILEISALELGIDKINQRKRAESLYRSLLEDLDSYNAQAEPEESRLYAAMQQAATLTHYFAINSHRNKLAERASQSRQWLYNFSTLYQTRSKDMGRIRNARYYQLVSEFGLKEGRGDSVAKLVDILKNDSLDPVMKANIDLMVGYALSLAPATAGQAKSYLAKAPSSSVYGRIAHRLTSVLLASGIDGSGNIIGEEAPSYKKDLNYVLNIAKGAPEGVQIMVLDTAFFLWRARDPQMKSSPFPIESYAGLIPADAYRESLAIAEIGKRQYAKAIENYELLAKSYIKSRFGVRFDRRVWGLHLRSYKQRRRVEDLQSAFKKYWPKYMRASQGEAQALSRKIIGDYKKFSKSLIIRGFKEKPAASAAIANIDFLLTHLKKRSEAYEFKFRKAQLLSVVGKDAEAVDVYLDIAQEQPAINYANAIKVQSRLANWPAQPPWSAQVSPAEPASRKKLLSIYDRSTKYKGSQTNWLSLSHIGLLYRSLGNPKAAEALWLKFLKQNPRGDNNAMEAAGTLFTEFYQGKNWNALIDLSYLALKSKFIMSYRLKPVGFQKPFSDALFFQSGSDLKARNYDRSTRYLNDFIKYFPSDPRLPQAYHNLADAYMGLGKLIYALNSKKVLVDKFIKYPKIREVLLKAGNWAKSNKKTVEYTFFFYGKFLNMFGTDPAAPTVREQLAQIYLGQKLYGWASRLYKEQSLSKQNKPAIQLAAAIKYLEIEEKFGQPKDAAFGANRILQLAPAGSAPAGRAYSFLARYAVARNDMKAMQAIEPKLLPYVKSLADAKDALGMMKFKMAQILTRPIQNTEANAFLKDPEGAVKGFFDAYLKEKVHYEAVCAIGISESCAPALFKLVSFTESAMLAIQDVEIASTLEASRVNAFKVFKQLHLGKLEAAAKSYSQKSLQLARSGTTSNLWKTEIVKSLASKTKFGVAGQ